jgi:hypothetical protein
MPIPKFITDRYVDGGAGINNLDWGNIAKDLGAAAAIYGVVNPNDSSGLANFFGTGGQQQPVGYTGGIPNYTASRELAPNAFAQTYTTPTGEVAPRRPGSAGRRYFTDTQFTQDTATPFMGITAEQIAAQNQAALDEQALFESILGNVETEGAAARAAKAAAEQTTTDTTGTATTDTTGTATTDTTGTATTDTTGTATTDTTTTDSAYTNFINQFAGRELNAQDAAALAGSGYPLNQLATSFGVDPTELITFVNYYTNSESLFQGIDASDGFDETEIGRVAALMNKNYTDAGQVGKFFNIDTDDVNTALTDYNTRTDLISDLDLIEGQQEFTFDQLNKLGTSGLETQYLADTFGVDADALQRAIEGASTITGLDSANGLSLDQQGTIAGLLESGDVSVNNVAKLYDISPDEVQAGYSTYKNTVAQNAVNETIDSGDFDAIAELITSDKAGISDVASRQGTEGMDVVEELLRGGYETPAEMAARLAPANEGLTEVDLVVNLLNTGRANPEEVASYYRETDPEQFADLTAQDVEQYLVDINKQKTTDYLKGLSDEKVGALINSGELEIGEAVKFYQYRYPGLTLADAGASMKAMGYALAQGGNVNGYYLGGATDGMADQIPATIDNMQPAALSDGEFVIPADVVSHLGNGNSDAGAQNLYSMMERSAPQTVPATPNRASKLTLTNT